MEFTLWDRDINEVECDLLAMELFEDDPELSDTVKQFDRQLDGHISRLVTEEEFKGKEGKSLLITTLGRLKSKRILLLGVGKREDFILETIRKFAFHIVNKGKDSKAKKIATVIPGSSASDFRPQEYTQALIEGIILGAYQFDKYKGKNEESQECKIDEVVILTEVSGKAKPSRKEDLMVGLNWGRLVSEAVNMARDIGNEPPNIITPLSFAELARKIATDCSLDCHIYGPEEIEKMGMGAFAAVSKGSTQPAKFIHLIYRPQEIEKNKILALVGKCLTYDSGGLSLKPSASMKTMKSDKSGAVTVLAVMSKLKDLRPNFVVHGIMAATENMPGGNAYKPDDILKSFNGKTIEVIDTDAEGRLTLADALAFAVKQQATEIIDLATLTGACIVALGEYTAGVMGNNQPLIDRLLSEAKNTGEKMWQLPFDDNLKEKLKSDVADLKNLGDRYGGAITAGMFLENFVDKTPWVHIDIAGPAFHEKGWGYNPKGASGFGVRTLLEYIKQEKESH